MRLYVISFLVTILLLGCSGKGTRDRKDGSEKSTPGQHAVSKKRGDKQFGDTKSLKRITFDRDLRFGSTDKVVVGNIAAFTVDELNRVFIADMNQTTIHVFSSKGKYITSLGRPGKGPGEFGAVTPHTTLKIYSDKLYVTGIPFFPPREAQVFKLNDLSFSYTLPLVAENRKNYNLKGYYPFQIFPLHEGKFIVSYRRSSTEFKYRAKKKLIKYFIQNRKGKIVSNGPIFKQKGRTYLIYKYPNESWIIHSFPFFEKSLFEVSKDDHLFAARTETFQVGVFTLQGKREYTIQHPFKNKIFNKGKVLDRYEKTGYMSILDSYEGEHIALKMIRAADHLPETWPALETMFFDDQDRLWVATIVNNNKVYEWWVLKKSGEVIAKFKWPRDKSIEQVFNGYMYTQETDENGTQEIVRYKIGMN